MSEPANEIALPPLKLLHDNKNGYETEVSKTLLIKPLDAVRVMVDGGFSGFEHPATYWDEFIPDDTSQEMNKGSEYLAKEIIGEAVEEGRLRCAMVRLSDELTGGLHTSLLFMVDPAAMRTSWLDWHDLPYIRGELEDGAEWGIADFLFFWDDVVRLRPCLGDDFGAFFREEDGDPLSRERGTARRPERVSKTHMHAAPVAALALQIATLRDAALAQTNKVLASRLAKEYEKLGIKPPTGETLDRMVGCIKQAVEENRSGNSAD